MPVFYSGLSSTAYSEMRGDSKLGFLWHSAASRWSSYLSYSKLQTHTVGMTWQWECVGRLQKMMSELCEAEADISKRKTKRKV